MINLDTMDLGLWDGYIKKIYKSLDKKYAGKLKEKLNCFGRFEAL